MIITRRHYLTTTKYMEEQEKELVQYCLSEIKNYENSFFMNIETESDKTLLVLNVKCLDKWNSKKQE